MLRGTGGALRGTARRAGHGWRVGAATPLGWAVRAGGRVYLSHNLSTHGSGSSRAKRNCSHEKSHGPPEHCSSSK